MCIYIYECVCVYIFIHMHARMHHRTHKDRGKSAESGSLSTMWDLWGLRIKFRSSGLSVPLVTELSFKKRGKISLFIWNPSRRPASQSRGVTTELLDLSPLPPKEKGPDWLLPLL